MSEMKFAHIGTPKRSREAGIVGGLAVKPTQKPTDSLQRSSQIAFRKELFVEPWAEPEVLENQDSSIRVKINNFGAAGVLVD